MHSSMFQVGILVHVNGLFSVVGVEWDNETLASDVTSILYSKCHNSFLDTNYYATGHFYSKDIYVS